MRYLQGLNWTLLALGATFSVVLSVVCLLLYINLGAAPEYRPQFESTRTSTLLFIGVMLTAAAAVWTHRQRNVLRWPAELLLAAACAITILYFLPNNY